MKTAPLVLCALALGVAGCSDSRPYRTAPVSGRVTLDGQPLADARLTFQPERDPKAGGIMNGPEAHGVTDADGRFTLTTVFKDRGATIGRNRVTIMTRKMEPVSQDPEARMKQVAPERVPAKYFTAKGWLYFDVPPDGTKSANFDLTTR
jgi:hypothetical protein